MTGPVIRAANADDAPALAVLMTQLGYPENTATEVAARMPALAAAGGSALVAEIDGSVVGCLTTSIMQVLHRPRPVGRISMFVIREDCRGQGIGKAMLAEAEDLLRSQGCALLEVTSNVARESAHRFYETQGWQRSSYRFSRDD